MISLAFFIPTPDFFGIGEFWSGVIVGILLIPAGWFLWFLLEELIIAFDREDIPRDEEYPTNRPAAAGVLVSDYADMEMLQTIAQQKEIDPEPVESERGRKVGRESSVGAQKYLFFWRRSRKASEEEKARYEHRADHNVLLAAVLNALDNDNELRRNLAQKPEVSLGNSHVMDELASMAESHSEAQTAREALTTITSRLMAEQKRKEFERAVEANAFVLLEGMWVIHKRDSHLILQLGQLIPAQRLYGPDDTDSVDMPDGVSLEVKIPYQALSEQGRDRLDADEQSAAVFGVATKALNGTLSLTPFAVFSRFGVSREGVGPRPHGAGAGYPYAC